MLIKYSQKYNFSVFSYLSLEVAKAELKIFCVMILSLVDTSLDFGLLTVVRSQGQHMSNFADTKFKISDMVAILFKFCSLCLNPFIINFLCYIKITLGKVC